LRQLKLKDSIKKINKQSELNFHITKFIYNGLHAFSTAEEPAFIELIQKCLGGDDNKLYVLNRKQVAKEMEKQFSEFKSTLKNTLSTTSDFIAITANVWKAHRRYVIVKNHNLYNFCTTLIKQRLQ